jgi:cellulose synthase/poly-beta-1,6-N-acetylglucosamine synthase-like glycosyltransferase
MNNIIGVEPHRRAASNVQLMEGQYMQPGPTLSIVIPCYNEGKIVEQTFGKLRRFLEENDWQGDLPKTWEIIFVNDGSLDQTNEIVGVLMAQDRRVRLCTYPHNGGQGKALKAGFQHARGEWVFTVDADLDYGPEHIERFLHEALKQQADLVVGSPYMPGGRTENVPWIRLWMSRAVNRYLSLAFNITIATFTGILRLYRRGALENLLLTARDKDILPEIIVKAHLLGWNIIEIPATLCWQKDIQTTRGRGIGVVVTARKAFRHILLGVVENPGLFFSIPIVTSILGLSWFTFVLTHLFCRHMAMTDDGLLLDITNTFRHLAHTFPHTFFIFLLFFFTTMILTCIGLIIYQNKAKKDHDYHCFVQLSQMIRQQRQELQGQERGEEDGQERTSNHRQEKPG